MLNHAKLCENFRRKKKRKNGITRVRDRRRFIRYSASWWKKKKEKRDEKISIEICERKFSFSFFHRLKWKIERVVIVNIWQALFKKFIILCALCKAYNLSIALGSQRSIIDYFLADRYRRKVGGTIKKRREEEERGECVTRDVRHIDWLKLQHCAIQPVKVTGRYYIVVDANDTVWTRISFTCFMRNFHGLMYHTSLCIFF